MLQACVKVLYATFNCVGYKLTRISTKKSQLWKVVNTFPECEVINVLNPTFYLLKSQNVVNDYSLVMKNVFSMMFSSSVLNECTH